MHARPHPMECLDADSLLSFLRGCPMTRRCLLAVSGGLDSMVLMDLFSRINRDDRQTIHVLHVNHRLQVHSQDWAEFTAKRAAGYGFDFTDMQVNGVPAKGDSIEDWARQQRYDLFKGAMQPGDVLFTAHHLDDQVETFFLQAFRGAGPRGLAAMSVIQSFGEGWHARPFLGVSRQDLERYAEQHELDWIDDPSNNDAAFDRNFLRSELIPMVESRWPAYRKTIARLVSHQAETGELLDELAQLDLTALLDEHQRSIDVKTFSQLSAVRRKNVLLYWARQNGLATPNSKHLKQIDSDLLATNMEGVPYVNWADVQLRRYRERLYLIKALPAHDPGQILHWDPSEPLLLGHESLVAKTMTADGIRSSDVNGQTLTVRFRRGGERFKPSSRCGTKSVKQLFQEQGVLPWWRDRIPLIYLGERLVAIPGIGVDEAYRAAPGQEGYTIIWTGFNKSIEANG